MSSAKTPEAAVDLLQESAIGKTITALDVHGINSLKTLAPLPSDLAGHEVTEAKLEGTLVAIAVGGMKVLIDLQRAGVVRDQPTLAPWSIGDGPQPTLRLRFSDGSGIDFSESNRTKRITVRIVPS